MQNSIIGKVGKLLSMGLMGSMRLNPSFFEKESKESQFLSTEIQ